MTMKLPEHLIKNLLYLSSLLLLLSCEEKIPPPPNIVFILADDLGWADLPVYGNSFNEAPHLTKLAQEGMQFYNAYAACPVCSPTRASIQTGQYPARLGIIDFLPGHWRPFEKMTVAQNRTQYLPQSFETLGELAKKANYKTGYFGKWHLGGQEQNFPKNQGYDESVIFQGSPYYKFNEVLKPNQQFPEDKILAEALTDLSIEFIEKHQEDPFFLFLAHYDVHVQLDSDSALIEKYLQKPKTEGYPCNAIYAAMVEQIDRSVGRVMEKLRFSGLEENTMVIFFSDNGGLISRFDKIPLVANSKKHIYENDSLLYIASSNAPLRAEKGTLYEGGIREPLIVKWPGQIIAGTKSESMVSSVDFFPTFSDMFKATASSQVMDGHSLMPDFRGTDRQDRAIYWHYPVYHHSQPASAVREGDLKLIYFYDEDRLELYNLRDDVGETQNLASHMPKEAQRLKTKLDDWLLQTQADLPTLNASFDEEKRWEWGTHPGREMLAKGE